MTHIHTVAGSRGYRITVSKVRRWFHRSTFEAACDKCGLLIIGVARAEALREAFRHYFRHFKHRDNNDVLYSKP